MLKVQLDQQDLRDHKGLKVTQVVGHKVQRDLQDLRVLKVRLAVVVVLVR